MYFIKIIKNTLQVTIGLYNEQMVGLLDQMPIAIYLSCVEKW
jgi:hypothetical protein